MYIVKTGGNMIDAIKNRLMHRTKILAGQINGLEKMIDEERYCIDIMQQSIAVQKSLASLNKLLLENHIKTHLSHQLASRNEKETARAVRELVNLYELNNIRGGSRR
jgi:DNA-binding FrmR family transcriptional regulator